MAEPDFRSLCAELVSALRDEVDPAFISVHDDLLSRADAALAQPAPGPPTDEELQEMWISGNWYNEGATPREFVTIARAVLARWGQGNG